MELIDYASPFASSIKMLVLMLFAGHAIADFGLQSKYVADFKSRHMQGNRKWFHVLLAHSLIHGGVVAAITGSAILGMAEVVLHFAIDDMKCAERYGDDVDQALHYACKILWVLIMVVHFQ